MAKLDLLLDGFGGSRAALRGDIRNPAAAFREVQESVNILYDEGVGGGMSPTVYDPQEVEADVFDRENHTGTQLASSISDFDDAVDALIPLTTPDSVASTGTPSSGSPLLYDSGSSFSWGNGLVTGVSHARVTVDDATELTATSHSRETVSGASLVTRLIIARHSSNQSSSVTLTLEEDCTAPIVLRVGDDQEGTVTVNRSGSNTFNGGNTSIVLGGPGATITIEPSRTSGDFAVEGEYVALRTLIGGIAAPVLSASGTLSMAVHSGHIVLLTGNATVPVTQGFNATLVASGGSRDIDAGGSPLTLASGDAVTVFSNGTTVWYTAAVTLSTLATS